tara:strand:- start:140 stop:895 length:756 start_codon:yes stop_codon:yes gene_type:complete
MKSKDILDVIITCSPLPSHPSTKHIDRTIESLSMLNLPVDTKIILAHDGHGNDSRTEGYLEYLNLISKKYTKDKSFYITVLDKKKHLTGNIRNAFNIVTSKYVLVIQHDLPFIKDFDIQKIIADLDENPQIKHLRFNKRKNIEDGCDKVTKGLDLNLFGNVVNGKNYQYISTPCWSDNNHICCSKYYRDILFSECGDNVAMEVILFPKLIKIYQQNDINKIKNVHDYYGTYIFDMIGSEPYIFHTDGYPKY